MKSRAKAVAQLEQKQYPLYSQPLQAFARRYANSTKFIQTVDKTFPQNGKKYIRLATDIRHCK